MNFKEYKESLKFRKYGNLKIIIRLIKSSYKFSIIKLVQRRRFSGSSSINFFGGLDFFLITLFFLLNHILNNLND